MASGEPITTDAFDVAISGYGPTGLTLASLLARRGHRVCVIERWPTLYGQPRMATIDGESARILQAACDIDAALRNALPRARYVFANGAGDVLIDHRWGGVDISGFPFRISVHQPDIEDAMDARARSHGVVVLQGWEVVELAQDAVLASITARKRHVAQDGEAVLGDARVVKARYVVGADGARSRVRTALGIARESWPFRAAWLSVDSVRKRGLHDFWGLSPDGRVAVIFCVPNGRAHSIIPLGTRHVRFNFQVDPDADHSDKLDTATAYRALETVYGVTPDDVDVYRQAVYPFEGKLATTWRAGRAFLAGDAAHLMTPFLGQGGCSALRDAINLAWKLDLVLRGVAPDALLDTYQAERLPHTRTYIDGSDRLAALAFVADPHDAAARDRMFLGGGPPASPAEPTIEAGILHRDGHGRIKRPAGELGPQGVVTRGGTTGRFDDLVDWGFQLLGWDCDPVDFVRADQRQFLHTLGTTVARISSQPSPRDGFFDRGGAYGRYFQAHGSMGMIMRPDFVIFGIAHSPNDLPDLVDDLRRQLWR
ncbi:MAG: bifunctional 3-(3-hydroxy-phenyl)propionate/3-hydroxycinnamic acid hydroxylase [Burkholderiales bacterium]